MGGIVEIGVEVGMEVEMGMEIETVMEKDLEVEVVVQNGGLVLFVGVKGAHLPFE